MEYARFADVWRHRIASHPLFSARLSRWCEKATLSAGLGGYPWHLVAKSPAPPDSLRSPTGRVCTRADFARLRRSVFGSRIPLNHELRALCEGRSAIGIDPESKRPRLVKL